MVYRSDCHSLSYTLSWVWLFFFTRKRIKYDWKYSKSAIFVWNEMAADLRLLGAQRLTTERASWCKTQSAWCFIMKEQYLVCYHTLVPEVFFRREETKLPWFQRFSFAVKRISSDRQRSSLRRIRTKPRGLVRMRRRLTKKRREKTSWLPAMRISLSSATIAVNQHNEIDNKQPITTQL